MNRNDKLFNEICIPIYRQLYAEATPSADFDKLIVSEEVEKDRFFMKYYLDDSRQLEIIEEHIKKHTKKYKVRKHEKDMIKTTILLGCSPRSVEEVKL